MVPTRNSIPDSGQTESRTSHLTDDKKNCVFAIRTLPIETQCVDGEKDSTSLSITISANRQPEAFAVQDVQMQPAIMEWRWSCISGR